MTGVTDNARKFRQKQRAGINHKARTKPNDSRQSAYLLTRLYVWF